MNRDNYSDKTVEILDLVASERGNQERLKVEGRFVYSCADLEISHAECLTVLAEEMGECAHEVNEGIGAGREIDKRRLLKELIQVAAVAVAWAEKTKLEIESGEQRDTVVPEPSNCCLAARVDGSGHKFPCLLSESHSGEHQYSRIRLREESDSIVAELRRQTLAIFPERKKD